MISEVVSELEEAFQQGQYLKSVNLLRSWLETAEPGEPATLIRSSSVQMRPRIAGLMRDLLSRYPSTLMGCPILIYAVPEMELDSPRPPALQLPYPRHEISKPCADVQFLGWLPSNTQLPVPLPFRPENYDSSVQWATPTVAVALFRTHPSVLDLNKLELPATWWGELFLHANGNIRLSGQMLFPYPEALEAAAALQAAARGEPPPLEELFLSDTSWARDLGVMFHEECRNQFHS